MLDDMLSEKVCVQLTSKECDCNSHTAMKGANWN